jgi:hypothetical protein
MRASIQGEHWDKEWLRAILWSISVPEWPTQWQRAILRSMAQAMVPAPFREQFSQTTAQGHFYRTMSPTGEPDISAGHFSVRPGIKRLAACPTPAPMLAHLGRMTATAPTLITDQPAPKPASLITDHARRGHAGTPEENA